jgi:DNA-binding transcriptional MocR family regulator
MSRVADLSELGFCPDPNAAAPIYQQLAAALAEAIRGGRLGIGTRLPSERRYAQALGVSRTTVTSAYQELKSMGLTRGYVGHGALVVADDPDRTASEAVPWARFASRQSPPAPVMSHVTRPAGIPLADGWLHPGLVPHAQLMACASRVATDPGVLNRAAPLLGLPALQDALIDMLRGQQVRAMPGEVLITGGAQQGLNVVARALISPGDTVLCENLTWTGAARAFHAAGAEVVGVAMDHEGVDPEALEDALVRRRPKFVYLMPGFQCPTGRQMSLTRRRRILDLCARTRTPILESHVYGDLAFDERLPSLKSLDSEGLVIHQGSASKTVSPALRLGWLVAPRAAMDLLAPAKSSIDLCTPVPTQAILAEFLNEGGYARHLVRIRGELRVRRDALITGLAEHCPALRFVRPEGGLYLWAQLPQRLPAREFEAAAAAAGVAVRSGDAFLANGGTASHIRLCFAAPAAEEIAAAAERMGRALQAAQRAHRNSAAADSAFASV